MLTAFKKSTRTDLKGFFIWMPVEEDKSPSSFSMKNSSDDKRFLEAFDNAHNIGSAFSKALNFSKPASEIFMIYPPGVKWTEDKPPVPSNWMHLLSDEPNAIPERRLTQAKFEEALLKVPDKLTKAGDEQ